MGRVQFNARQIAAATKYANLHTAYSHTMPFSRMAVYSCFVMLNVEHWSVRKTGNYILKTQEYYAQIDNNEELEKEFYELCLSKDIDIKYVPYTVRDVHPTITKKNKYVYQMVEKEVEARNTLQKYTMKFLLCHFKVLIDHYKMPKEKLLKNKDEVVKLLVEFRNDSLYYYCRDILVEYGIVIEEAKPLTQNMFQSEDEEDENQD